MSDLDLTAIRDRALRYDLVAGTWVTVEQADAVIAAAAPLIEAAVREHVAQEIESEHADVVLDSDDEPLAQWLASGLHRAALLARAGDS